MGFYPINLIQNNFWHKICFSYGNNFKLTITTQLIMTLLFKTHIPLSFVNAVVIFTLFHISNLYTSYSIAAEKTQAILRLTTTCHMVYSRLKSIDKQPWLRNSHSYQCTLQIIDRLTPKNIIELKIGRSSISRYAQNFIHPIKAA